MTRFIDLSIPIVNLPRTGIEWAGIERAGAGWIRAVAVVVEG